MTRQDRRTPDGQTARKIEACLAAHPAGPDLATLLQMRDNLRGSIGELVRQLVWVERSILLARRR